MKFPFPKNEIVQSSNRLGEEVIESREDVIVLDKGIGYFPIQSSNRRSGLCSPGATNSKVRSVFVGRVQSNACEVPLDLKARTRCT